MPGRLVVIVVGYDETETSVQLIGKGTDGRALQWDLRGSAQPGHDAERHPLAITVQWRVLIVV